MIGGISGVRSYGMNYAESFYQRRLTEHLQNAQTTQAKQNGQAGQVWTAQKAASPETPVQPVGAARPVSREEASPVELTRRLENDPAAMAGRMRTRYGEVDQDGQFVETGKNGSPAPAQGARMNTMEGQLTRAENALGRSDLKGAESALNNGAPDLPGMPENAEKPSALPGQEEKAASVLPGQKEDAPALPGEEGIPGQKDNGADTLIGKTGTQGAESAQKALEEGECKTCEERKYQDGSDDMGVSYQTPTNIKPEQAASAVRGHEMEHVYREQAKAEREDRKVVSQTVTMHTEICPECGKSYVSGGTTRTVTKADTDNQAQQDAARQNMDDQARQAEDQKTRTPFSAFA